MFGRTICSTRPRRSYSRPRPSLLRHGFAAGDANHAAAVLVSLLAAARHALAIAGINMCPHRNRVLVLVLLPPSAGLFRLPLAAGSHRKGRRPSPVARALAVG